jgi:hypothetical protein
VRKARLLEERAVEENHIPGLFISFVVCGRKLWQPLLTSIAGFERQMVGWLEAFDLCCGQLVRAGAAQHVVEGLGLGQLGIFFCHGNGEDADFFVVG